MSFCRRRPSVYRVNLARPQRAIRQQRRPTAISTGQRRPRDGKPTLLFLHVPVLTPELAPVVIERKRAPIVMGAAAVWRKITPENRLLLSRDEILPEFRLEISEVVPRDLRF